jgi:hypothetical protein
MEMILRLGIRDDSELIALRRALLTSIAGDLTSEQRATTVRMFNRLCRYQERHNICVD